MTVAAQNELVEFLLDPRSYSHHPRRVRIIQTHASWVFLATPYVYKVKKPVNFGFLDFSTLEKRRFFSEREVLLNRRLSPDVYLGVVPISAKAGRFTFGSGDEIVEYAVHMRKLPERYFLHRRMARHDVKCADLDRVVATLKNFYESQTPSAEIAVWGRIDRLRISTDENFSQTARFLHHTLSRPAFETVRFYTEEFYRRQAALFASRIEEGWIRDCHGDLHADHVHITPRALHIYDCIEFNDRLRYLDVANDAAFLAMDLDYLGRPDLARHFVTSLAASLKDGGLLRLMDFYKCYRAYVRGKVESLQSIEPEVPEAERRQRAERARRYFRLALQYAIAGSQPLVLALMGRVASGKSALAKALTEDLGWTAFSSDRVRKTLAGAPLRERSDRAARAKLYSPAMTQKTYDALLHHALAEVQHGRCVLLDATYGRRVYRERLRARLDQAGVAYRFVEARASDEVVKGRLKDRESQRHEVSDARLEDFETLDRLYESPKELGPGQLLVTGTDGPMEATLIDILKHLAEQRFAKN
jgi:hypothetical protein